MIDMYLSPGSVLNLLLILCTLLLFTAELQKLEDLGYGKIITKERMKADGVKPIRKQANIFLKVHFDNIDRSFFKLGSGEDATKENYVDNYWIRGQMDEITKNIIATYHPDKALILPKPKPPRPPVRPTALDFLSGVQFNPGKLNMYT